MKSHKLTVFFFFIATAAGLWSCKKKSNSSSGSNKLALIDISHLGAIQHYRIVYDAFNNVDSMVIIGGGTDTNYYGYLAFNYFGSSYSVTDASGASFTVSASTTGVILGITAADSTSFIYNGAELGEKETKTTTASYPFYTKVDTNFAWNSAGDMVGISFIAGADSCHYNLSKAGQIGDALRIDAFLSYGRPYIETTHLPVDMTELSTWLQHYFYQFDSQGRISQFLKVKNNFGSGADDSTFYNYQYYAL